ncbi:MAG TPA: APC family permease [Rhodopila sp.]|uniref:APC family permease n=1 Tax=Rhodopila sp. TaxID=2480087 RepID=UPI002BCD6C80|nr:APC family permease [Rhodopila sp.]HVY17937.1 APC family permease [Rhodopila sp.]
MASSSTPETGKSLRRDAGIIGLLFASTTSMIGSGWLFGALHASKIAGPLSLWSWIIGAVIIMLIALCFAELAGIFPRSGALVHMSHASHGDGLGRVWGWMLFLSYIAVPPVEAESIVTYANNLYPHFVGNDGILTTSGLVACAALVGVLALLNLMAIRWLLTVNNTITWWKIAVPFLTAIVLIFAGISQIGPLWTQGTNVWSAGSGSYDSNGVFIALPAAGIVFSFLGFRTAIDLGGESSNPGRNIPLAVIGSVLLSAAIYILLQVGFLESVKPQDVANGWGHINFPGVKGPFAGLAAMLGFSWLATLLYIDAAVSPAGTGLIYVTAGARILFANGEMKAGPEFLTKLNSGKVPWVSVAIMWIIGVIFLLPFPAWQKMVDYISDITALTYGLGPIVLLILRRDHADLPRPFRLVAPAIIAPIAFICCDLIILWSGFTTVCWLFGIVLIIFALYLVYFYLIAHEKSSAFGWDHIWWLGAWFGGMWIISALSGHDLGGDGVLGFWPAVAVTAAWSLIVIELAKRSALPSEETGRILIEIERTL